jgi:hypothetical protein
MRPKLFLIASILTIICSFFLNFSIAQQGIDGWLNKKKKQVENKIIKKVDNVVDDALSPANKTGANSTNKKGADTKDDTSIAKVIVYENNYKNVSFTTDEESKYFKVANDLYIDIGSLKDLYEYPYGPFWNIIDVKYPINYAEKFGTINFEMHNYIQNINRSAEGRISITNYNGNAFVTLSKFLNCNCAGRLVKNGEKVVIVDQPQTFFIDDFYEFVEDLDLSTIRKSIRVLSKPCKKLTGSWFDEGGWRMKLVLNTGKDNSISISAIVESLVTQSNLIKKNGTDVGKRWIANNAIFTNRVTPEMAAASIMDIQLRNTKDSLRIVNERKREIEMERLFEIEIKDSYAKVVKIQSSYNAINNSSYLKVEKGEREERQIRYEQESYAVSAPYDPSSGRFTQMETRSVPVTSYVTVQYEGLRNKSKTEIIILGISKFKSPKGTIYYKDASIKLAPGEITNSFIEIENSYNPKTVEINSTHYYKTKLPIK